MILSCYIRKYNYNKSEKIQLYVSYNKPIKIEIINIFDKNKILYEKEINNINLQNGVLSCKDSIKLWVGYNWKKTCDIDINFLNPGFYIIKIKDPLINSEVYYIPFILTNTIVEKDSFLVLVNTNTYQAYNWSGGGSFYNSNSNIHSNFCASKGRGAKHITYDRPNKRISDEIDFFLNKNYDLKQKSSSHLFLGDMNLIFFLKLNNYKFNFISDIDLHLDYNINNCKGLILNTHPEYWTEKMSNKVQECKNIISLAGNVSFRKVKLKWNKNGSISMHKKGSFKFENNKLITGSFYNAAGYLTYSPYKIINEKHFLFKGININEKKLLGTKTNFHIEKNRNNGIPIGASGWETDKIIIDSKYLLARGLNNNLSDRRKPYGGGDIIFFEDKNKCIFSVGSVSFNYSIQIDKDINKLCKNVFDYFLFK